MLLEERNKKKNKVTLKDKFLKFIKIYIENLKTVSYSLYIGQDYGLNRC